MKSDGNGDDAPSASVREPVVHWPETEPGVHLAGRMPFPLPIPVDIVLSEASSQDEGEGDAPRLRVTLH